MKNADNLRFLRVISNLARRYKMPNMYYDLQSFLWELQTYKNPPNDFYILACLKREAYRIFQREHNKMCIPLDNFEIFPAFVGNSDLALDVRAVLEKLKASEAAILTEIYFFGYSVEEIANALGISRQAVNKRKNTALKKAFKNLSLDFV